MGKITSHVLDTSQGKPASGVPIVLEFKGQNGWSEIGRGETNVDGRANNLLTEESGLKVGAYRMTFDTSHYYGQMKKPCFYPEVSICFRVENSSEHYHIPLLTSGFGLTSYRGS